MEQHNNIYIFMTAKLTVELDKMILLKKTYFHR